MNGSIPLFGAEEDRRLRTKKTFDVEWVDFEYGQKIYGHTKEEELEDFFCRMAVDTDFLRDRTVLDAGCGVGRLAHSVSRYAREVVAVDFSEGIREAHALNKD